MLQLAAAPPYVPAHVHVWLPPHDPAVYPVGVPELHVFALHPHTAAIGVQFGTSGAQLLHDPLVHPPLAHHTQADPFHT